MFLKSKKTGKAILVMALMASSSLMFA